VIYALISKTKFNTYWVTFKDKKATLDTWECAAIVKNKSIGVSGSVLKIKKEANGYKLYLEHDGNVVSAIFCNKVFKELGVKDENKQSK
jgi:hypothetical protein